MFALIYDNKVIQVEGNAFDVAPPLFWVECNGNVVVGDIYDVESGSVKSSSASQTLAEAISLKLVELGTYRYSKETAGVLYNNMQIDTSRDSQQMLSSARTIARDKKANNVFYTVDWKAGNGWYTLNSDQIIAMSDKVAEHVQSCFTQEKKFATIIKGLTSINEVLAYDFITPWK